MNVEKFKALVEKLITRENQTQTQSHLNALNEAVAQMASNPSDLNMQLEASKKLHALAEQLDILMFDFDAANLKKIEEIGAYEFFTVSMVEKINDLIQKNPMTPAVVQQAIKSLAKRRQSYLNNLIAAVENLNALKIESEQLTPGEAEVGFQLPRAIFNNNLEGLIDELRELRFIIRAFSELATGTSEDIEVRQISTSDPQFFFGLSVSTIVLIGAAVTWALDKWEKVEQIRKIRAETRASELFTPEETEQIFGDKIKKYIHEAVEKEVSQLINKNPNSDDARNRELSNHIRHALSSILARIERGMTVEIRFLPPRQPESDGAEDEKVIQEQRHFTNLRDIANKLAFPKPDANPVLTLPKKNNPE